jgi:protein-disulfide isomerase
MWPAATMTLLIFMISNWLISRENTALMARDTERTPESAVARVAGETISKEELERPLSQPIYQLEEKIYRLKRNRLEELMQDILLNKEAEHRGTSKKQLAETVLNGRLEISEDEVERYCDQNRRQMDKWEGSEKDFKEQVRQKLVEKKEKKIIGRFAGELEKKYDVEILLEKPALPLTQVDIEGRPALGPDDAEVVVVEYSDPFCPACRQAHATANKVRAAYDGQIRWVFKDFPLKAHKGAELAAEAAHCAEEQGRFWEYQDKLFNADGKPDIDELKAFAAEMGLECHRFDRCLDSRKYRSQVEDDIRSARQAGIAATPTFIINGRMMAGVQSFDDFKRSIDSELEEASRTAGGKLRKDAAESA